MGYFGDAERPLLVTPLDVDARLVAEGHGQAERADLSPERWSLDEHGGHEPGAAAHDDGEAHGQERTAPVLYLRDDGRLVVIGSNAGNARAPAWSHNLKANPNAEVEIGRERLQVQARVAEDEERAELWSKVNRMYEGFDEYDARTSRDIAVFVLEPR